MALHAEAEKQRGEKESTESEEMRFQSHHFLPPPQSHRRSFASDKQSEPEIDIKPHNRNPKITNLKDSVCVAPSSRMAEHEEDIFEDLLNLEEKYHTEGYNLGAVDGARAGRIEGRTFGLEKGFEKFVELGRLAGRADIWNARIDPATSTDEKGEAKVMSIKGSERLKRQIERLRELTDPESLSTVNDEESVNAFDDRLREARAKATLVSKMVGERELDPEDAASVTGGEGGVKKGKAGGAGRGGEMEDFAGLPSGKRKEG